MKKIFTILVVLILGTYLIWFSFFSSEADERYIKGEIVKANYCKVASDCQLAGISQCPFGCYIYVNKNESTQIINLLKEYKDKPRGKSCAHGCIELTKVGCINNICQPEQ